MLGFIITCFVVTMIASAIWKSPDPHANEWTDKALGLKKKHRHSKWDKY